MRINLRPWLIFGLLLPGFVSAGPYLNGIEITPPKGWHIAAQNGTTAPPQFLDGFETKHPGTKQLVQSGMAATFLLMDQSVSSNLVRVGSNIMLSYKRIARDDKELATKATAYCPSFEKEQRSENHTALECRMKSTSHHPYLLMMSRNANGVTSYSAMFIVTPEKTLVVFGTLIEEPPGAFRSQWDTMLEGISY
jgi:hypothetical protein